MQPNPLFSGKLHTKGRGLAKWFRISLSPAHLTVQRSPQLVALRAEPVWFVRVMPRLALLVATVQSMTLGFALRAGSIYVSESF